MPELRQVCDFANCFDQPTLMAVVLVIDKGGCVNRLRCVLSDVRGYRMRSELSRPANRPDLDLAPPPHMRTVAIAGNTRCPRSLGGTSDGNFKDFIGEVLRRRRKVLPFLAEPIEPHHDMEVESAAPLILGHSEV
jgi:hypothetical protein